MFSCMLMRFYIFVSFLLSIQSSDSPHFAVSVFTVTPFFGDITVVKSRFEVRFLRFQCCNPFGVYERYSNSIANAQLETPCAVNVTVAPPSMSTMRKMSMH